MPRLAMLSDWFKQMFSIAPEKPLTLIQRFTCWSALFAYVGGGLSMILVPDLWNMILHLDFSGHGKGYFILCGGALVTIGFGLIVKSRATPQVAGQGAILATILGRLVLVNLVMLGLYLQGLVTVPLAVAFPGLDSTLALITCVVWPCDTDGANVGQFFVEIWAVVNPCSPRRSVYDVFQAIGYLQFVVSLVAPLLLQPFGVVAMDTLTNHSKGLLWIFFTMLSLHGWFQALAGGAGMYPFLTGAIFYRLAWSVPFYLVMAFTSKIGIALAAALVSFDAMYVGIISGLLVFEFKTRT